MHLSMSQRRKLLPAIKYIKYNWNIYTDTLNTYILGKGVGIRGLYLRGLYFIWNTPNNIVTESFCWWCVPSIPDSKLHGANMGPTWVLSAPDGPRVGPMNLVIRDVKHYEISRGTHTYGQCVCVHRHHYRLTGNWRIMKEWCEQMFDHVHAWNIIWFISVHTRDTS